MLQRSFFTTQLRPLRLSQPASPTPCSRPRHCFVYAGKKKGGSGGSKQKKGAGSLADPPKNLKPYLAAPVIMQNLLLIESYFRKTGNPLFEEELEITEVAQALWENKYPILAHDSATDPPGPVFVYANKAALDLFEAEWEEIIGIPSTKSAEPIDDIQQDRSTAIAQALEKGYIDGYSGNRISFKGTKFRIDNATLFNVEAPSGDRVGQAVVIRGWEFEDGRKGGDLAVVEEEIAGSADGNGEAAGVPLPSAEELAAAEAAVVDQASVVRDLKENKGLKNSDLEVEEAVAVLLERKQALEALKNRMN